MRSGVSKYFQLKSRRSRRRARLITVLLLMITVAAAILIVNRQVINHRIYSTLGTTLKEWVAKETDGLYILEYDSMTINSFKRQVSLQHVIFRIDSSRLDEFTNLPANLYDVRAPGLFLELNSVLDVLFDHTLKFNSIKVSTPKVSVINISPADTTRNISLQSGKLYITLNKYLDEFNIEEFRLFDGSIFYKQMNSKDEREISIQNIDTYIDNLVINTHEKTTGTDQVIVILKKPSFTLADGLHKLEMDSLILNSKSKNLLLNEVVVYPDYQKLQEADLDEINLYNFNFPNIELQGIDLQSAYKDNRLLIDRIYIPDPSITVDTHKKNNTSENPKTNNFFKQLSHLFNNIHANTLLIEGGKVDLALEANNRLKHIRSHETTILVENIELDTLKFSEQKQHLNFDRFNLKVEDYSLILPDSIHILTAEAVTYNSDSNRLSVFEAKIDPADNNFTSSNRIKATIPEINLNGFDADRYFADNRISLENIKIINPSVIYYNSNINDSVRTPNFNFAIPENTFTKDVSIKNISAENIDFQYIKENKKIAEISGGNIALRQFYLSKYLPGDQDVYLNSGDVNFNIPRFTYHTSKADDLNVSEITGDIRYNHFKISSAKFTSSDQNLIINGENFEIKGTDIKEALITEKVTIDTLKIGRFSVEHQSKPKADSSSIENLPLLIKYISLNNGAFTSTSNNFEGKTENINGYINKLDLSGENISFGNFHINLKKVLLNSTDKNIIFGTASAELTNKKVILHLPFVRPQDKSENGISLQSTQAALINYNFKKLINDKSLHAEQLKLLSADFEIHKNINPDPTPSTTKNSLTIDWEKILDNNLKEIEIGRVVASGPALSLEFTGGTFSTGEFEFELKDFSTNNEGNTYLLNSKNIRIKTNSIDVNQDDARFQVQDMLIDEKARLMTLKNLEFQDINTHIKVPTVFARQLDLRKLAEENKISGEELELVSPEVLLSSSENKENEEEMKPLPAVRFQKVSSHQGVLSLFNEKEQEYKINGIDWELTDFDTKQNYNKVFYSEKFFAKASTLTGWIKNKMDKLVATGIEVRNNGNKIIVDRFYLKPELDKQKYAYQIGYETDWINLTAEDISIDSLDLYELVSNNAFIVKSVTVDDLKSFIYRDKKLPFPKDKYSPLPQETLRNMKNPLWIGTINVRSADITYEELSELAFEPGELAFQDLDITIKNITNIKSRLNQQRKMVIEVDGYIEGTSLYTTSSFDLLSEDNEFTFSGRMGEGGLTKFNKIMENNVFLRIDKGHSRGLTFNLKANDEHALGKMRFYYKNLKVAVIDKHTNKTSGFDESIASFFANTFVINNNNPSLFVLKEGDIFFNRDKSKSVFNYWAKSFLSGVVSSIGVKNNKKELKEALSEDNKTK